MRYLVKATQAEIDQINHEEAVSRGCSGTTQYWYVTRPCVGGVTLMINDDKNLPGSTSTAPEWIPEDDEEGQ